MASDFRESFFLFFVNFCNLNYVNGIRSRLALWFTPANWKGSVGILTDNCFNLFARGVTAIIQFQWLKSDAKWWLTALIIEPKTSNYCKTAEKCVLLLMPLNSLALVCFFLFSHRSLPDSGSASKTYFTSLLFERWPSTLNSPAIYFSFCFFFVLKSQFLP